MTTAKHPARKQRQNQLPQSRPPQKPPSATSPQRLNKFIANNSKFSRRKADELISDGKVKINGQIVKELGKMIEPGQDSVTVFGQRIAAQKQPLVYLALNKPKNYISTRSDELERKTVMELLPPIPNLRPVGRLDKDTEGLLLFSNDGNFINKMTHPGFNCEKEYLVELSAELIPEAQKKLEQGVKIDGKKTWPAHINIIKRSPQTKLTITIHEGRNRQIRKMFASQGLNVKYLQRLRIGIISLENLAKGQYRSLTKNEINAYQSH